MAEYFLKLFIFGVIKETKADIGISIIMIYHLQFL